jgi:hypothetical protein
MYNTLNKTIMSNYGNEKNEIEQGFFYVTKFED